MSKEFKEKREHSHVGIWWAIGVLMFISLIILTLAIIRIIDINAWNDGWGSFCGSISGGVFGAIIAIGGVALTIRSNNKNTISQIERNKIILSEQIEANRLLMKEELKAQFKPILSFDPIRNIELLDPNYTYIRNIVSENQVIYDQGWFAVDTRENIKREIKKPWAILSLSNIGNGAALDVRMTMEEINSSPKLNNLSEIRKKDIGNLDEFYETCETSKFNRKLEEVQFDSKWELFSPMSIKTSEKRNFVFNFDSAKDDFHALITVNYIDGISNSYTQQIYIGYITSEKTPFMMPVSAVRENAH